MFRARTSAWALVYLLAFLGMHALVRGTVLIVAAVTVGVLFLWQWSVRVARYYAMEPGLPPSGPDES